MTKDVSGPKASQRELISRDCAVDDAACDRTNVPATAKPPCTVVDGALIKATTGGEFSEGMNKRLTFELTCARRPQAGARQVERRVGRHCPRVCACSVSPKPGSNKVREGQIGRAGLLFDTQESGNHPGGEDKKKYSPNANGPIVERGSESLIAN